PTLTGGHHHIGTTRMSEDPARGVVDGDCRVHGIANLYVAGSSVFPNSGSANLTLTVVALALRLAAHLEQRLAA
ncbi:MAG: oxidoreductase, partial [Rhodospirillales bacterium]|nr:oxidoreductase [Rhodospirillales bacterium]